MSKPTEGLKVISAEPIENIDELTTSKSETTATNTTITAADATEEVPLDEVPITKEEEVKEESKKISSSSKVEEPTESAAPPQPPRPVDPITQITNELKDAFPNIEDKFITAVLIASQGQLDPAFNALLYISDPSFKPEIPIPQTHTVAPPVPAKSVSASNPHALSEDEILARRLQKEFENEEARRRRRHERRKKLQQQQGGGGMHGNGEFDDNSPDEFEQIKETFNQGLEDARSTLNGWVSNLTKRFDANDNEKQQFQQRQGGGGQQSQQSQAAQGGQPKLFGALGGSSFNRRQHTNFDEDPEILSSDFHHRISLNDNDDDDDDDDESAPPPPTRPGANAAKPLPKQPSDVKIATTTTGAVGGATDAEVTDKKWQPLEADVPANSDAFLVDSEEEDVDAKK
ncbi:hypothetical protein DFJ63DRAFT_341218 [Scheffersomyces coipomensis]|uniref:uncharacterized protein n=1 Tax=Scheffersomyces coipomensis TaxID=1788519 RepID=UPI00315CEE65